MQKINFNELSNSEQELLLKAKDASKHYYNPTGNHFVGAALRTLNDNIFQGAAIRRQSASQNTCSERMAIDQAIFSGEHDYKTLVLIGFNKDGTVAGPIFPCGACRQIIFEFYREAKDGSILVSSSDMSQIIRTDIHELLPSAYKRPVK
jgi:cytidine deaminase